MTIINLEQKSNHKEPITWLNDLPSWIPPLLIDIIWLISDDIKIQDSYKIADYLVKSLAYTDKIFIMFGLESQLKRDIYNKLHSIRMHGCIPIIIILENEIIKPSDQIIHLIITDFDKAYQNLLDHISYNKQCAKLLISPSNYIESKIETIYASTIASKAYIIGPEIKNKTEEYINKQINYQLLDSKQLSFEWYKFSNY